MISFNEYTSYDGLGLAELVSRKEITAQELNATAHEAIKKINPVLNAVLQTFPEASLSEVSCLVNGPFKGVPFLIKELGLEAKDIRFDMGSKFAQGYVSSQDSELMVRFRRAGFVLVGTTQTPELGYCPTTESKLFGPVHNPWDLRRSAGGSSGGSGAAVAAGIVPIAHANDGGGSIRIPASCNALVGLKPSRDRIATGPQAGDPLCGLACEFALARSIRDIAALLDAVSGPDAGAPGHPVPPMRTYREEIKIMPDNLRIAWTTRPSSGLQADPECEKAVHSVVDLLQDLGHVLIEDYPIYDWEAYLQHLHIIWASHTAFTIDRLAAVLSRKPDPYTLEAATLACYEEGKRYSATDLCKAMAYGNLVSRQVGAFFHDIDIFLTPTIARLPALLGEINQDSQGISALEWTYQIFNYVPFTSLFNWTGQPAISLPLHFTNDDLPVGIQFAGRLGDEATLLRLASQLEQARPWSRKKPFVHVSNLT